MFNDLIIKGFPELIKFFHILKLNFYFTNSQTNHMCSFVIAMMLSAYKGKTKNVSELSLNVDRSCVSRFLDSGSWNDELLIKTMQRLAINQVKEKHKLTKLPIYFILDDTICEKTLPSSKAENPIEGCGFHHSHLTGKKVYGHQFVTGMLRCGDLVLPYETILYEKEKDSKIKIARKLIEKLSKEIPEVYVLTDSWYASKEIIEDTRGRGYQFIGAIKRNRIITPRHHKKGIQIAAFAKTLRGQEFDLVTIKGKSYFIYTYLGKLKGIEKPVKIVISYPKGAKHVDKAMKAFVSTDIKLSGKQILNHYVNRWPILSASFCYAHLFLRNIDLTGNSIDLGIKRCA